MLKIPQFLFWSVLALMIAAFIYLVAIISWATVTDYKPKEITAIKFDNEKQPDRLKNSVFTFLNWHIGYAGLRDEMGQITLSNCVPEITRRYSYFSAYSWPKRLFMLD